MATTPVFLPGGSHGQRSLAGYSPWGHKESDTTACAHTAPLTESPCWSHHLWRRSGLRVDGLPGSQCGLMREDAKLYRFTKGPDVVSELQVKPYNVYVTVAYPPDTDTPGFAKENQTKVSMAPGPVSRLERGKPLFPVFCLSTLQLSGIFVRRLSCFQLTCFQEASELSGTVI